MNDADYAAHVDATDSALSDFEAQQEAEYEAFMAQHGGEVCVACGERTWRCEGVHLPDDEPYEFEALIQHASDFHDLCHYNAECSPNHDSDIEPW